MAHSINWTAKQRYARNLCESALRYAIADCMECVECFGHAELRGKDSNYYRDEMSIYIAELRRRGIEL